MGFAKNSLFIAHELNARTAFLLVQFTKDICLGFKLPVQPSSPLASTHMLQNMHLDSSRLTSNYAVIILINSKEQVPFCKTKFWATLRFSRRTLLDGINENYLIINTRLNKFSFNAIRSFVIAFKAACHLSLSWARSIQYFSSYYFNVRFNIILSSTPSSSKLSVYFRITHQNSLCISLPTCPVQVISFELIHDQNDTFQIRSSVGI